MFKPFKIAKDIGLMLSLVSTAPVVLPLKVLPIPDPVSQYAIRLWDTGDYILRKDLGLEDEEDETTE